jgi:hypothetical protein
VHYGLALALEVLEDRDAELLWGERGEGEVENIKSTN